MMVPINPTVMYIATDENYRNNFVRGSGIFSLMLLGWLAIFAILSILEEFDKNRKNKK